MGIVKKKKKLSSIFAFHIIFFCISVIVSTTIITLLFFICINASLIRPANYYEKQVLNNLPDITNCNSNNISSYIPDGCVYAVYDESNKILNTNINDNNITSVKDSIKNIKSRYKKYYFKEAVRKDGTKCLIGYSLGCTYKNNTMNKYVIPPNSLLTLLYLISFITNVTVFSKTLSKKLHKEFKLLKDSSENINMENLDFKIQESTISEINEILNALDKMKNSLKSSLENQWAMEEAKNSQINALAHDIKTPLTIIKGNSELLSEMNLDADERCFNDGIINESSHIEKYLKCLLEMINFNRKTELHIETTDYKKFINNISISAKSLASIKNITFNIIEKNKIENIKYDYDNLTRAIMNVITNAFDYCSTEGVVTLEVKEHENCILFVVSDNGNGFSKEALVNGTKEFFQGDKSRNSKNHYGMGLFIAGKILKLHGGTIALANSKTTYGGEVTMKIPK